MFISGYTKSKEINYKHKSVILTFTLLVSFIAIGLIYISISQFICTKITVNVINQSDFALENVKIYGSGNIFENPDTLKIKRLVKTDKIKYVIPLAIIH